MESNATRKIGGHGYAQFVFPKWLGGTCATIQNASAGTVGSALGDSISVLCEGTAPVLHRMLYETAEETKSVSTFAMGLSILATVEIIRESLDRDDGCSVPMQQVPMQQQLPVVKPLMMTTKEHTKVFYANQCISSFAVPYAKAMAMETVSALGAFNFTRSVFFRCLPGVFPIVPGVFFRAYLAFFRAHLAFLPH